MVTDHPVSFGTLLRQYRSAARLTQEELAARSGLGVRTVAYLEADRRGTPRRDTVLLLADALGLSPDERDHFLAWSRPDEGTPPAAGWRECVERRPAEPALHPLVGRDAALAQLDATLRGEGPPVFLLAGEPGIGKSRLLREAARRAASAGWTAIAGGSRRQGGETPYAPLLEALHHHLAGYDPRALRRVLAGCAWLVRLLPELADLLEPLPASSIPPEHEQRLMVDAIARLLANVAGPAGTLLLLDDLQWAEQDTVDLLAALVRHPRAPMRIVGAYRDTEAGPGSPLQQLVADLARTGLVAHHPLGPLSDGEAASLLASLLAGGLQNDPEVVRHALERAGGMPFYLISYAQALRSGGGEMVPWDLAAAVRQRVSLAADAAEILGISAIVGRQVPRSLLLRVSRQPEESVLAGLEVACRARLLLEDGPDAYVFAHDVIREVIEEDLGAAQRASLHGRVAESLERQAARTSPDLLAYHFNRSDTSERAAPYLESAAEDALTQYAYGQAERYERELVTLLDELGQPGEAARIREKLGELLRRVGRFAEAREVVTAAVAWYRQTGDLEGAGRTTAQLGLILDKMGASEEAHHLLIEMAQEVDRVGDEVGTPSPAAAPVWQQLATVYGGQGRYEAMLQAADRAAEIARALGDEEQHATAQERRGFALNCLGRLDEARAALEEAIPVLEAAEALPELVGSIANLAENRRVAGDLTGALKLSERVVEVAVQTGTDRAEMAQLLNQSEILMALGEWERAKQQIVRAEAIGQTRETAAYVAALVPYHRAELALRRSRWDEATDHLRLALERATASNRLADELAETLWAELELLQGTPGEAQQRLMSLLDRPEPNSPAILPLLAWSSLELGAARRGLELAQEAERTIRERQMLLYLPEALRIQGMALARLGRIEEARSALSEGLERARGMPLPYTEARILTELGLLACREGQNRQSTELLDDALAIFRRLGAAKDAERATELLADLSLDLPEAVSQNSEAPISLNSPAALSQKSQSAAVRLTDAQWDPIAVLLPPRRPGRGRPRADDRQTLEAILYVQRTGCAWADLPPELGNDATAHRRWREWQAAGLWEQIAALVETPEADSGEK